MSIITKRTRILTAILSGILLGLSYPPTGIAGGMLAFFALVPLLVALEQTERLRTSVWIGYAMCFFWSLIAAYWVGGWKAEGNVDPFLMTAGAMLTVGHPLFLFVPILLYDITRRRFGRVSALVALPILWVGFEYFHSIGDLAFPWLSLHNTQTYNLPFIQFIEYTGSYGLSFLIVLINIALYIALRPTVIFGDTLSKAANALQLGKKIRLYALGAVAALIALPYLYGFLRMSRESDGTARKLTIAIIQPNINPWAKWEITPKQVTDSMQRASLTAMRTTGSGKKVDLLLWPETAITYPLTIMRSASDLNDLYAFIGRTGIPILTGIPDREEYRKGRDTIPDDARKVHESSYYRSWNSALLFYREPSGKYNNQRYHKQKLVPFGERVPFVEAIPVLAEIFEWGVGLGSWNTGTDFTVFQLPYRGGSVTAPDTARLCAMVCYESIYPDYVREFVVRGANIITIVTNDGWYGKSSGPYQHNQFAVLRAIENRRWVARSANTGVSSIIDEKGNIAQASELLTSTSVVGELPLRSELTLYTRIGDVIAIPAMWAMLAMWAFYFVTWLVRKRKKSDAAA